MPMSRQQKKSLPELFNLLPRQERTQSLHLWSTRDFWPALSGLCPCCGRCTSFEFRAATGALPFLGADCFSSWACFLCLQKRHGFSGRTRCWTSLLPCTSLKSFTRFVFTRRESVFSRPSKKCARAKSFFFGR